VARPVTVEIAGAPLASVEPSATSTLPRKPRAPEPIVWETSERDARERAERSGSPLIVWVRAAWATSALQMERKTWSDPRVAEAARGFVAVKLDLSDADDLDAKLAAERYQLTTMPTTVILDARGRTVATLRGYADADAIVEALAKVRE
jgi:thiol:disulfide interchange protein